MPGVTIRGFQSGDETVFLKLLKNSFGPLEYAPRLKAEIFGPYFNREGSFIAEKDGSPVGCVQHEQNEVQTMELSKEDADDAAEVWVEGLRPYWNFWIEEQGGAGALGNWVKESVGTDKGWIGAFLEERLVGLAILVPDFYGPGESRFNGAYVLPKFRERRVGSALMNATIREACRLDQRKVNVYTTAFLDHLAPEAVLYLKSGGNIEAEYLQLQRKANS